MYVDKLIRGEEFIRTTKKKVEKSRKLTPNEINNLTKEDWVDLLNNQ